MTVLTSGIAKLLRKSTGIEGNRGRQRLHHVFIMQIVFGSIGISQKASSWKRRYKIAETVG